MSTTKVAVVTGSNKGIGYAVVKELCRTFKGAVYLTARDVERGHAAVNKLNELGLKPLFHQLDITDVKSIETFRDFISNKHGGIDVLVNNAAIAYKVADTTPFGEQAENTININYFGLLNTSKILFPLLRPHARVVNVSSSAGHLFRIPDEKLRQQLGATDLTEDRLTSLMRQFVTDAKQGIHVANGWGNSAYVVSKVGVSALSFVQQRSLNANRSSEGIVVNAVHPGYVDTDMTSHKGHLTIEQGAEPLLYLALQPVGENEVKGKYVWCNKQVVDWYKPLSV